MNYNKIAKAMLNTCREFGLLASKADSTYLFAKESVEEYRRNIKDDRDVT